jgi:acetyltransferase-like isoleucine patch superfamily enzyme
LLAEELGALNPRLTLALCIARLLPEEVGGRLRASLLRLAGLRIGSGTIFNGTPSFTGGRPIGRLLTVGSGCWFNVGCRLDVHSEVTIGNQVRFGQEVLVLTHTHLLGLTRRRAGDLEAKPVHIGDGAWLGARVTVLPGVTIGDGAVVAAGSMVTRDVEANTLVGGLPAKLVRNFEDRESVPAEYALDNNALEPLDPELPH